MKDLLEGIAIFTLAYPSLMAMVWVCGGLYYYFQWERRDIALAKQGLELPDHPKVTLMVPCYNEGANVEETIGHLLRQRYPDFEVLAINDGSKDDTGVRLDRLAQQDPRLTVLHQHNQGKAMALNNGLAVASGEILVGIDGDAVLDYDAVRWMVKHFIESPRVGAVTGNPRCVPVPPSSARSRLASSAPSSASSSGLADLRHRLHRLRGGGGLSQAGGRGGRRLEQ